MKSFISLLVVIYGTQLNYRVEGVVKNADSGVAINNVTVEIKSLGLKTKTDHLGHFVFKNVPQGKYELIVSHKGFQKVVRMLTVDKYLRLLQISMKAKLQKTDEDIVDLNEITEPEEEQLIFDNSSVSVIGKQSKSFAAEAQVSGLGAMAKREQRYYFNQTIPQNTEEYAFTEENRFFSTIDRPLSTFSIDVDGASYSNVRRFLKDNQLPPKDAVRVEEFINYFSYDYQLPDDQPFSTTMEIADCPWNPQNKLIHIGIQGEKPDRDKLANSHLTFLIDVSGSMNSPNKLPLLKKAFSLLVNQLGENDKVSIVVYAGAAGNVLEAASANDKQRIMTAINNLNAGGSTAGGQGIQLAYKLAERHFIEDGNNRIILATDGDFNVGVSNSNELQRLIEEKRKTGVSLTVIGFGMGNYKDAKMEILANKGNGNYAYIDNLLEAKKVFVNEVGATLHTIAKDVKLQIEFNPQRVKSYRLIGYENRLLNDQDFNDDQKDAGELGAGHTVTALYEIVPANGEYRAEIPLKYQQVNIKSPSLDWLTLKIRYKQPKGDHSQLLTFVLNDEAKTMRESSENLRFSAAVAEFAMILKDSKFKGNANYQEILKLARTAKAEDQFGYRAEFIQLVELAELLSKSDS